MKKILFLFTAVAVFTNCTSLNHTMRETNTRVNLTKNDFVLSDQVSAEAKSVKVLGIDWGRLFLNKTGGLEGGDSSIISGANIPVIGNLLGDCTSNYALFELMAANPGYDVVFYPQYETKVFKPILGIGFLTKITNVKTTARLGKLSK